MPQLLEVRAVSEPAQAQRKGALPRPLKGLLLLLLSLLGLLLIRTSASTVAEGWIPVVTMLAALCFVIVAAVEVVRAR